MTTCSILNRSAGCHKDAWAQLRVGPSFHLKLLSVKTFYNIACSFSCFVCFEGSLYNIVCSFTCFVCFGGSHYNIVCSFTCFVWFEPNFEGCPPVLEGLPSNARHVCRCLEAGYKVLLALKSLQQHWLQSVQ